MATGSEVQTVVDEETQTLERTWISPPGLYGWFTHVTPRSIGRRFIITAMIFFLVAGIQALLMRLQLGVPENTLMGPDFYRQLFTMHGTTMMFFFAVPVMEGFGIYLVPLIVGTRDMAFPSLTPSALTFTSSRGSRSTSPFS